MTKYHGSLNNLWQANGDFREQIFARYCNDSGETEEVSFFCNVKLSIVLRNVKCLAYIPVRFFLEVCVLGSVLSSAPAFADQGHFEPGLLDDFLRGASLRYVAQREHIGKSLQKPSEIKSYVMSIYCNHKRSAG